MTEFLKQLSIIIPFYGEDIKWKDLLQDLRPLPREAEILLVGPDAPPSELLSRASENMLAAIRFVWAPKGRGSQLNAGTKAASNNFFWFLHADSKVPRPSLFMLAQALQNAPDALHYFDLHFLDDGPKAVILNSLGANFRSRYLGLPFGDQAFAVSRAQFYKIGGFAESAPYGEDHLLIWQARRKRVPIRRIAAPIFTSARSYKASGWGALTSRRLYLTYRQAAGELIKLAKERTIERVHRRIR